MKEGIKMNFDNVIIHYYPEIDCIAKCAVNLRQGTKIVFRLALADLPAVNNWLSRMGYDSKPRRMIYHNI